MSTAKKGNNTIIKLDEPSITKTTPPATTPIAPPIWEDNSLKLTGSIGDKVWLDANGNGLQDAGERGLAGVKVELIRAMPEAKPGQFLTPPAPGYFNPIATTKTDANGNYIFKDVPANQSYQVRFTSPDGYQFTVANAQGHTRPDPTGKITDKTNFDLIDSDAGANGMSGKYTLLPGQNINHVDAGLIAKKAPALTGSIGDKVWLDTNGNGLQDAGERGLAGVKVELIRAMPEAKPGQFLTPPAPGYFDPVATTKTDANGNYIFKDVPANQSYQVRFTSPDGYQFTVANAQGHTRPDPTGKITDQMNFDLIDSDAGANGMSGKYTLLPGQNINHVDAGLIAKKEPVTSSIGNKVWHDANGNGVQDAGEAGVAGVQVKLWREVDLPTDGSLAQRPAPIAVVTTDKNGNYNFDKLTAGDYRVEVVPPKDYAFTKANVGNDKTDSDIVSGYSTEVFPLGVGQKRDDIDAGLVKKSTPVVNGSIGDKVWVDANGNGMQDAGERGLAGVKVELVPALVTSGTRGGATEMYTKAVAATTTDANGNYAFKDVAPGMYQVRMVTPEGYRVTKANVGLDTLDSDFAPNGMSNLVQVVAGKHNADVDAGLVKQSGAIISGQAWSDFEMAMIEGGTRTPGVRDNGEMGIENVAVALYDSKGQLVATTSTDKSGNYRFGDLKDGDYKVHFAPQGNHADSYVTTQNAGSDDNRDSDINRQGYTDTISIRNGKSVAAVDAGYVGNDALETYARVGNRVWNDLDHDGKQDTNEPGMGGVKVHAYSKDGKMVATKQTDANGNFEFKLDDGEYRLHFDLPVKEERGWLNHYEFSPKDKTHDAHDSDANATGYTDFFSVHAGQLNVNLDAGMFASMTVMPQNKPGVLPMLDELVSNNTSMDLVLPGVGPTPVMMTSHDSSFAEVSMGDAYRKLFDLTQVI